ncbi:hypothetical protein [Serratia liquefaciens]|uniref:hypothetical protein n=1 Tax=Serratia liquefaciens TaxID=614 RepID=UPI00390594A9
MNTQNVKTAAPESSERWGGKPTESLLDLSCSTSTLIELVGIESQLMQQKALVIVGAIKGEDIDWDLVGEVAMDIDNMFFAGVIFTKNAYDVACSIHNLIMMLGDMGRKNWKPYSTPSFNEFQNKAAALQAEAAKVVAEEQKPFRLFAEGATEYREDDWRFGSYYRDETTHVCCVNSIQEAVAAAKTACTTGEWNIRDAEHDYYDEDLGHDCGPISFTARTVTIKDREGLKVLAGEVLGGDVYWKAPATDEQIEDIREQIKALQDEACTERHWDNRHSAQTLERRCEFLDTQITHEKYRSNAEVLRIIEVQRREEFEQDLEAQAAVREEDLQ